MSDLENFRAEETKKEINLRSSYEHFEASFGRLSLFAFQKCYA